MEVYKEFRFEAAHNSPNAPEGHICHNLHGHSYKVIVTVNGPVDEKTGWVTDFNEIKVAFQPILIKLDHKYLNSIPGLENPSAENLAIWIWKGLKEKLPLLSRITVCETATCGCIYEGS